MFLRRYQDFKSEQMLNENLAGARKIIKDLYFMNKSAAKLKVDFKTDSSGLTLLDRDGVPFLFNNLTEEEQNQVNQDLRTNSSEYKLGEQETRNIERNAKFQEIRTMLGDKLGWMSLFVYLHFREGTTIEELRSIFDDMCRYNHLLTKLRRNVSNYIDAKISNNAEQLIDDLEDIKRYSKLKKFIDEFNSELKRDYAQTPKFFKDKLMDIAGAFDELGKITTAHNHGKIDPELQRIIQKRFFDKIGRYKTVRELTAAAESFLKAESNADSHKFFEAIDRCQKKYGDYGVKVLYDEGGLLIMEVLSFAACKELFSNTSWCIAQYLGQWDNYVGGETVYNKQYSILNFNLSVTDKKSIIGITIEPRQKVRACHLKDDSNAMSSFKSIFNDFEESLGLEKDFIFSGLKPMTDEEVSQKKKRTTANREVVKKGLSLADVKRYIVDDGADVNASNGAALDNAVSEDDIEKVKFLLEYGASPNLRSRQEATVNKTKSFEILKLLIAKGAEITAQVFKSLAEDEDAVRFCLDNGLDPNFEDNMPLRFAIKNGKLALVKMLEEYQVNTDNRRQMNTKHAAEYQRWDVLEYLISKGGGFIEGFEEVMKWCGHTRKIQPASQKIEVLNRLQGYIDDGRVKVSEGGYKIGTSRDKTLKDVLDQFGSVKNLIIASNPELVEVTKK
jgi:hypothetical protein